MRPAGRCWCYLPPCLGKLVAEGIESEEQLDCLRKLGCESGQGFLVSPPVSATICRDILWQLRTARTSTTVEASRRRLLSPVN